MVNFGWNKDCKGWKEKNKWQFAEALETALNIPIETGNKRYKNDGKSPYIEVDGAYGGVRIRRITWLSEKEHEKLIVNSEKIYKEIMG